MKVSKFGGTSVASAEQINKIASIVKADPSRKIIVVSAPGKRSNEDIKITDLLINLAEQALEKKDTTSLQNQIISRFHIIAEELLVGKEIVESISNDLSSRLKDTHLTKNQFIDQLKAAGEDNNAKLIAAYFNNIGLPAQYMNPKEAGLIVTDFPQPTQATEEAYKNLSELQHSDKIIVFPGFFGFTKSGLLRTFNRGGSDITGSILAAAVNASVYENFTDVDCVFSANPKVVNSPMEIEEITYREMRELSYAGFSVFHDEALMPVYQKQIPVNIKNTNNPLAAGTFIVAERKKNKGPITGITADSGFSTLYVSKYLMNRELGFGRKLLQILEEEYVSYEHTPSGLDDISIIIRSHQLNKEKEERIVQRIVNELEAEEAYFRHGFSMIVLVGEGMNNSTGLAARAATAISRTGANIEMINQGSSEVSIVFGVLQEKEHMILRELYDEFFSRVNVYS
ncbi:aspartate kinase [Sutcliffiella cohnii]